MKLARNYRFEEGGWYFIDVTLNEGEDIETLNFCPEGLWAGIDDKTGNPVIMVSDMYTNRHHLEFLSECLEQEDVEFVNRLVDANVFVEDFYEEDDEL